MRFHLLGGVTPAEATAAQAAFEAAWGRCTTRGCRDPVEAILLIRGPTGQPGDMQGGPMCAHHEAQILLLIEGSEGYQGAEIVVQPADPGEAA
ncbi:hypothetical protein L6R53_15730 [Myxococcota bacterium]|nr:hypothetical protein [Myxococcota bacterium]